MSFIFMTNMVPSCPYMTNYDYYMILRVNNVESDMNMLYIILFELTMYLPFVSGDFLN